LTGPSSVIPLRSLLRTRPSPLLLIRKSIPIPSHILISILVLWIIIPIEILVVGIFVSFVFRLGGVGAGAGGEVFVA
jgi:hypothetical protein